MEKVQGAVMKVDDLKELQEKFFSDKAKEVMKNKSTQTVLLMDNGDVYKTVYFGSRVPLDKVDEGAKKVAAKINDLADKGLIHSALSQLIKFDLAKMPVKALSTMVLCYVLVPLDVAKEMEAKKESLDPGSLPDSDFEDTIPLNEGEFFMTVRVHHGFDKSKDADYAKKVLKDEINKVLALLPPGTRHVSTQECAVTDLSRTYEVIFANPLLQEVKEIELEHTRSMARVGTEIKEFNVLTGIRYFGIGRMELYR